MTKRCDRCGIDYPDYYQFCPKCGSPLRLVGVTPLVMSNPYPQPQPYPQPPTQPYPPNQPSSKKFDFKIIGGLLGVLVALVLILVLLSALISPSVEALAQVAATAQQDFGGSWSVVKSNTGVAVYIGNGEYNVTLLNGKKVTLSYFDLSSYLSLLDYASFGVSGGNYLLQPIFITFPTKIDFVVVNGTVNGEKTLIIGVGVYYNSTPNPAYYIYNLTNYMLTNSTFSSFVSSLSNMSKYGVKFQIGSSNGFDYYFVSSDNLSYITTMPVSGYVSQLGFFNITSLGTYGEVSTNEEIAVIMFNVSPTLSQAQSIASEIAAVL